VEETLLSRILLSAEKRVQTLEGATTFMADANSLATVTDALKRPASGNLYTQWAASLELKRAVGTGARLLRFCCQVCCCLNHPHFSQLRNNRHTGDAPSNQPKVTGVFPPRIVGLEINFSLSLSRARQQVCIAQ